MPITPEPPLAMIPLPDGKELRIVGTQVGGDIVLRSSDDFEDRVPLPRNHRYFSSSRRRSDTPNTAVLFATIYDPSRGRFESLHFDRIRARESGVLFKDSASTGNGGDALQVGWIAFENLPRRSPQLELMFEYRGQVVAGKIPNFFAKPEAAPFVAKPLPQTQTVDGVQIEFKGVTLTEDSDSFGSKRAPIQSVNVKAGAVHLEHPTIRLATTSLLFDPTGNEVRYGALPLTDNVWGVRVTAKEPPNFPYPPSQIEILGKVKVPAPGGVYLFPVPPRLAREGVTDIFVTGTGNYDWRAGQLTGTAPGQTTRTQLGTLKSRAYGSRYNNGLTMFVLSSRLPGSEGSPRGLGNGRTLRLSRGKDVFSPTSTGSSGYSSEMTYTFGGFTGVNRAPGPAEGEEIEVAVTFPKERVAEFYFERPKFPGE